MLADVEEMLETEFLEKYLKLLQKLAVQFEEVISDAKEAEKFQV